MNTKFFTIALLGAALSSVADAKSKKFLQWAATEKKNYKNSSEMSSRFSQWNKAESDIESWPKSSDVKLRHNNFSDWTPEEFESLLSNLDDIEPKQREKKENAKGGQGNNCNPRKTDDCPCPTGQWRNNSTRQCESCGISCNVCSAGPGTCSQCVST